MSKIILTLTMIFLGSAITAQAGTLFKSTLSAAQEVPTNNSTGTGFGTVRLNDAGTQATINLRFSGLTSNQTASHIYGNAPVGQNAPILFNIGAVGGTSGTLPPVTINVTPQQVADLRAGRWYFNIHTANNPNGEIRAKITSNTLVDFNGDGKSDWAIVRRPGQVGPWTTYIRYNGQENFIAQQWGQSPSDRFQPVDYDGDGKDDIAVRRNNGFFYILNSSDNSFRAVFVGGAADNAAVAADYDGDGKDDPAVYAAPTVAQGVGPANWCYVGSRNNPQQTVTCIPFGMRYGTQSDQVDEPYPGDFDGDGRADLRVQRRLDPSNASSNQPAIFYTALGATGQVLYDYFGLSSDRILPGDYDGDGKTDLCVSRGFNISPGLIQFFIRHSNGQPDEYITFGEGTNFNFAQGDYDGDGKDDIALMVAGNPIDPQNRFWVRPSSNPSQSIVYPWGRQGDLPVAGYNNR